MVSWSEYTASISDANGSYNYLTALFVMNAKLNSVHAFKHMLKFPHITFQEKNLNLNRDLNFGPPVQFQIFLLKSGYLTFIEHKL